MQKWPQIFPSPSLHSYNKGIFVTLPILGFSITRTWAGSQNLGQWDRNLTQAETCRMKTNTEPSSLPTCPHLQTVRHGRHTYGKGPGDMLSLTQIRGMAWQMVAVVSH